MHRYILLVAVVAVVLAVASMGSLFMPGAWYAGLAKPSWTPPNWLFGPVWSVLYLMIAVAGWLVWLTPDTSAARWIWPLQLVFNGLWSPVMFGWHRIGLALLVIALLWLAIAAFVVTSWPRARVAALLFLPYLAWVSYASALNFALWRLNP